MYSTTKYPSTAVESALIARVCRRCQLQEITCNKTRTGKLEIKLVFCSSIGLWRAGYCSPERQDIHRPPFCTRSVKLALVQRPLLHVIHPQLQYVTHAPLTCHISTHLCCRLVGACVQAGAIHDQRGKITDVRIERYDVLVATHASHCIVTE